MRRFSYLAPAFLAVCLVSGGCTTASGLMGRGDTYTRAARYDDALACYEKAAAKYEAELETQRSFGNAPKAIAAGQAAAAARTRAAECLVELQRHDEALAQFAKGHDDAPDDRTLSGKWEALCVALAREAVEASDLNEGQRLYTQALKANPSSAQASAGVRQIIEQREAANARDRDQRLAEQYRAEAVLARDAARKVKTHAGDEFTRAEERMADAASLFDAERFREAAGRFNEAKAGYQEAEKRGITRKAEEDVRNDVLAVARKLIDDNSRKSSHEALEALDRVIKLLAPHLEDREAARLTSRAQQLKMAIEARRADQQRTDAVAKAEALLKDYASVKDTAQANRALDEVIALLGAYADDTEAGRLLDRAMKLKALSPDTLTGRGLAEVHSLSRMQLAALLVAELGLAGARPHAVDGEMPVAELKLRADRLTDLPPADGESATAAREVVRLGVMTPATPTTFGGGGAATRAGLARAVYNYYRRVLGEKAVVADAALPADVPADGDAAPAVRVVIARGLMAADNDGKFGLARPLSGAEAIETLNRLKAKK